MLCFERPFSFASAFLNFISSSMSMKESTMNTKILASALLAAAGLVAAPAFAGGGVNASGEVGYIPPVAAASSGGLSREAVRNELLQAQRNHQLVATGEVGEAGVVASAKPSTVTREQVQGEYLAAARNHQLAPAGEGADIGYRPSKSLLTREAVHAEAVRALRAGDLPGGEV
jgi:hypothetical protein